MNNYYKNYNMKLTTLSPLFIGDGKKITKKEYIYDDDNHQVIIPDLYKMVNYFELYKMYGEYQYYILNSSNRIGLGEWIKNKKGNLNIASNFAKYIISFKNAVPRNKKGEFDLNNINTFIKDSYGCPFIPGSSIKGMIRTALITYEIYKYRKSNDSEDNTLIDSNIDNLNNSDINDLENFLENIYDGTNKINKNYKKNQINPASALENQIFGKINKDKDIIPELKSNMRGLIIGDSKPLNTDDLTLSKKIDYTIGGKENLISLYKETIKPNVDIYFDLSIDTTIFPYSIEDIFKAINLFNEISNKYFYSRFKRENKGENIAYLGGGIGFLSKTIIYPAFAGYKTQIKTLYRDLGISEEEAEQEYKEKNVDKAVETTHRIYKNTLNQKIYKDHNHYNDVPMNISPHVCKCTNFNGELYNMGICKLDMV